MKKKIIPITALRDTSAIDKLVNESDGPISVTKNGYEDFTIVPKGVSCLNEGIQINDPMGFVRVMSSNFEVAVGNVSKNVESIKEKIRKGVREHVHVVVAQEMALTGYTIGDALLTESVMLACENGILEIAKETRGKELIAVFGTPIYHNNSIYNCAVFVGNGRVLGVVPKTAIPNYAEFYEKRYFQSAPTENMEVMIGGSYYPFGTKLIFTDRRFPSLKIAAEICEDAWIPNSPSIGYSYAGANVLINISASDELLGKADYRRELVKVTSAKTISAYVYCDAGKGESSSDLVYAGHSIVAENGTILDETMPFEEKDIIVDIDVDKLNNDRQRYRTFTNQGIGYKYVTFDVNIDKPKRIMRSYPKNPFLPTDEASMEKVWQDILNIQAAGLNTRLKTVHGEKVVIGLSGGLDSTLALLVCVEAFKQSKRDLKNILTITLPAFGTTSKTKNNAQILAENLGVSFKEINIKKSLEAHFADIGVSLEDRDVAYENAQARERTQVLMDEANKINALMVGTGDLSELCLGWCTYNGDHMSMYGLNSSIPKTVVKYVCHQYGKHHKKVEKVLDDIVGTVISPELLPANENDEIVQKTEDKVGPYELQDFFIYHYLRYGFRPKKLHFIAKAAFGDQYSGEELKNWLKVFLKRFFNSQFKRNAVPDGPKVGSVSVSPRGDLRLPSDFDSGLFIKEVDEIEA